MNTNATKFGLHGGGPLPQVSSRITLLVLTHMGELIGATRGSESNLQEQTRVLSDARVLPRLTGETDGCPGKKD
jgi:hypothetical protein